MDFLKTMLGNMADEDGADGNNDEVFDHAQVAGLKAKKFLLEEGRRYRDNGDAFKATLFLFTATWALVSHMYQGVLGTEKAKGKNNMVSKLWHLLRIAFTSGDIDRTLAKMGSFDKDYEEGKFNDL